MFTNAFRSQTRGLVSHSKFALLRLGEWTRIPLFRDGSYGTSRILSTYRSLHQERLSRYDREESPFDEDEDSVSISRNARDYSSRGHNASRFEGRSPKSSWKSSETRERDSRRREETPGPVSKSEPSTTIFIGNIPWAATEDDFHELFGSFGEITAVRIARREDGRARGFVHLEFGTIEEAIRAVEAHELRPLKLDNRMLYLDYNSSTRDSSRPAKLPRSPSMKGTVPPSNTVFVANVPFSTDEPELLKVFETFGTVKDVRIARDRDGRSRGFAHVDYDTVEEATSVIEAEKREQIFLQDRQLSVDYAPVMQDNRYSREPYHKLYFHGYDGTEHEMRAFLDAENTPYQSIFRLRDPETGDPQSTGFIEFRSVEEATDTLNRLNGKQLSFGMKLNLAYARPKANDSSSRGRSSNFSRGGFGGRRGRQY